MSDGASHTPVERWFLRRGIPHFIEDYAAGTHILTRVAPVLALVFVVEVILITFGDRFAGGVQALTVVGALALTFAVVAAVNRLRGLPALQLPDDIGPVELAVFVIVPALIALIFGTDPVLEAVLVAAGNVVFLFLAYVVTSYGLVPMTIWAFGQLRAQLRSSVTLMIKTLPLLLLFGSFFFLSTEVWQLADDFPPALYAMVLCGLVSLGGLFVAFSVTTGVGELSRFVTWDDVGAACEGTPIHPIDTSSFAGPPAAPPLSGRARFNLALVMFASQAIQVFLVAVLTFVGLVAFGLVTVRESTLVSWLGADGVSGADRLVSFSIFGDRVVLTRQLVYVAGFVAAFAGLQFAVSVVTDAKYRADFAEGMAVETRQALAVRTAYLATRAGA